MGIYDRDYIRREPPRPGAYGRGGLSGMRMWSVNTWIIVICVGVWFIDGFTSPQLVPVGAPVPMENQTIPPDAKLGPPGVSSTGQVGQPILTPQGQLVGWQPVMQMHLLEKYLHFSTNKGFFKIEFWRLIGFQFLHTHDTILHLLFNMVALFFFGPIVEEYLGRKRYLAFYLLCGIFGALSYCLLNLGGVVASIFGVTKIPGLLFYSIDTPLIGASAGVFGVLMAGAYLAPNATVMLFFVIPMKLRTFAYALVVVAVAAVLFGQHNAGGEAGHLGGAIAGYFLVRRPKHLHGFFDFIGRVDPTSHHYRDKRRTRGLRPGGRGGDKDRREIDRILDKIQDEGLHSLTPREKKVLRQASERP